MRDAENNEWMSTKNAVIIAWVVAKKLAGSVEDTITENYWLMPLLLNLLVQLDIYNLMML